MACAARGQVTNQAKSLTLQECVERALENNLEIRFQRITPTIQTWGVMGAQGVYDPNLSGSLYNLGTATPSLGTDSEDRTKTVERKRRS